jgi:23S rRNA (guanosine2251-2'-O)-methyltransferase
MRKDIIYGIRPVMEAVEAGKDIEKVFFKNGLKGDLFHSLVNLLKQHEVPFQFVPVEKLNRISRINHQGVIALISGITYHKLEEVITSLYEKGETPLILVLDGITDVGNFGALARTAECAGVHAILIPSKGGVMASADALKSSAGALHNIPVCRSENLLSSLEYMKYSGLKIVTATEKEGVLYHQAELTGPAALIMGSEDRGISPGLLSFSDFSIKIPVVGKTGSLNVSAAASVLLYEFVRQRNNPGKNIPPR